MGLHYGTKESGIVEKNFIDSLKGGHYKIWIIFFILWGVLFASCRVSAQKKLSQGNENNRVPIQLTLSGKSLMPIILAKNTTPRNEEAALELANYIRKISGAQPKILRGLPSESPESAIWIGIQPGLEKIFPLENLSFSYPEEILLIAKNQHILIAGRDIYDPKQMWAKDQFGKKTIEDIQQEYGTCNAVYTFIQDQLGVRWLWPGALGEDFPTEPDLSLTPFRYRYHPKIRDRSGILYRMSLTTNKGSSEEKDWVRFQRSQLSSAELFRVHHAFTQWWAKYHAKYPNIFALQPNGERTFKSDPQYAKLCQSNPMVWDLWLKDVENQLVNNPNQTTFNASANDGWTFGHCTCANCRSWDGPGFNWEQPNLSDREIHFANVLSQKLSEKYPGKNYKVVIGAYGYTRTAPVKERPSPQVILMNTANFLMRGQAPDENRELSMEQYADWGKITRQMAWRPNLGNPVGGQAGFPDIAPRQAARDISYVDSIGCIGLFFDTYWGHWANQGLQYYTLTQVAWNPQINVDSLLEDYHQRAYGPAAVIMKQYWEMIEITRNDFVADEKNRFRFMNIYKQYDSAWFEQAKKRLQKAKELVKNKDSKYRQRIDFADFGLQYAALTVKIREQMAISEANPGNKSSNQQVLAYWNDMKQLQKTAPRFAVYFNVTYDKPKNRAMSGLHPMNSLSAKVKKSLKDTKGFE